MSPEQFVYWLRGYAELSECGHETCGCDMPRPTSLQWQVIMDHLDEVMTKQTPRRVEGGLQGMLNAIGAQTTTTASPGTSKSFIC